MPVLSSCITQSERTAASTSSSSSSSSSSSNSTSTTSSSKSQSKSTAPLIYGVFPSSGSTGGGTKISLFGQNFVLGATVTVGGVTCTSPTWISSNSLTCITGAHAAGEGAIVLTNPDAQTASFPNTFSSLSTFTYKSPTLTSIYPLGGPTVGGTVVTLFGTNFTTNASVTLAGMSCSDVKFVSSSILQCTSGASTSGALSGSVKVVNSDSTEATQSSTLTFTYAVPTVTSVSPTIGPLTGKTVITVTGTNFAPLPITAPTVTVKGITCSNVIVNSSTQLQCTTGDATSVSAGVGSIVVTDKNGTTATGSNLFTYADTSTTKTLSYNSGNPLGLVLGVAMTTVTPSIAPSGETYSYSVSPTLPAGLSLNSSTGAISGTPSAEVTRTSYTITATQSGCISNCSVTATLPISVKDFGNGQTDVYTVSSNTTYSYDNYAFVSDSIVPKGTSTLTVYRKTDASNNTYEGGLVVRPNWGDESREGFYVGDRILIIQMQISKENTTRGTPSNWGNSWEFAEIDKIIGTSTQYTLYLKRPTRYSYISGYKSSAYPSNSTVYDTGVAGQNIQKNNITQIVRVRQATTATISATLSPPVWDATKGIGGVFVLQAKTLSITGTIDASGKGFHGGASYKGTDTNAFAGESWAGIGGNSSYIVTSSSELGAGAGGKVGSTAGAAPGGGGGYGSAGTKGTGAGSNYYEGEAGLSNGKNGSSSSFILLLGSGGGGGAHYNTSTSPQPGGAGGGLIFLMADALTVSGSVYAKGADGAKNPSADGGGDVSGSGSGGSIYLIGNNIELGSLSETLSVAGGAKVDDLQPSKGGGGGIGRVRMECSYLKTNGGTSTNCASATAPTAGTDSASPANTATAVLKSL